MEGLVTFLAALAIFWGLAWMLLRGRNQKIQVYPLLLIVRTGLSIGANARGRAERIISALGWPSIGLLLLLQAAFYYLALQLFVSRYLSPQRPEVAEGFVPFLPGVTVPLDINLVLVLFSLGIAVLVHELAHGLMARAVGVRVKDSGLILLAFIPGAFVEPDEEEIKRARMSSRAKIYSAGVAANVLVALAAILLISTLAGPLASGVLVVEVEPGSPAERAGLKGMEIREVNGMVVRTVEDLLRAFDRAGVTSEGAAVVEVRGLRDGEPYSAVVEKPAGMTRIGIRIVQSYGGWWQYLFLTAVEVTAMINVALALINAAPIFLPLPGGALMTDGAHLVGDIAARIGGERARIVASSVIGVATLIIVISLLTITPLRFVP